MSNVDEWAPRGNRGKWSIFGDLMKLKLFRGTEREREKRVVVGCTGGWSLVVWLCCVLGMEV